MSTLKHQVEKPRRIRAPHHRNDRHYPLTSINYRCHCQSTNTEIDATRSPSEISRCLSQETTTNNTTSQKVNHFSTINPISSMDTCLITDTTIDGHTSSNTTLRVITSQGSKPLQVHKQLIAPFQDHKMQIIPSSQDHLTTADVRDIIALKHAFPASFDTTGNMPGEYTICVDPSILQVQHTQVSIEARQKIKQAFQKW